MDLVHPLVTEIDSNAVLKECADPDALFFFPWIVSNAFKESFEPMKEHTEKFTNKFMEQVVKAGTAGRRIDSVGDHTVLVRCVEDMFKNEIDKKEMRIVPDSDMDAAMKSAMEPSFFGATKSWETTACENAFFGSMRITCKGTRKLAAMNWAALIAYLRHKGQALATLKPADARLFFRNMTKDTFV